MSFSFCCRQQRNKSTRRCLTNDWKIALFYILNDQYLAGLSAFYIPFDEYFPHYLNYFLKTSEAGLEEGRWNYDHHRAQSRSAVWVACARLLHSQRKPGAQTLKTLEVEFRRKAMELSRCQLEGKVYPWVNGKKWKRVADKIDMKQEGPTSKKRRRKKNWMKEKESEWVGGSVQQLWQWSLWLFWLRCD